MLTISGASDPKTEKPDPVVDELDEAEMDAVAAGYEPNPGSQYDDNYSGPF